MPRARKRLMRLKILSLRMDRNRLSASKARRWLSSVSNIPCTPRRYLSQLERAAERAASDAIQIHGGAGFLNDYPVEKIYRDVRVYQIYEGTSEVQKIVISRSVINGQ